ncbi:unnamed protein product [Caretta caretta]
MLRRQRKGIPHPPSVFCLRCQQLPRLLVLSSSTGIRGCGSRKARRTQLCCR